MKKQTKKYNINAIYILSLLILTILFFNQLIPFSNQLVSEESYDIQSHHFFKKQTMQQHFNEHGSLPLWDTSIVSGTPIAANIEASMFYPFNWAFLVLPLNIVFNYQMILLIFLAGVFTYLFAKKQGLQPFPSFTAAVIFMFHGKLMAHLYGGSFHFLGLAFFPLILLLFDYIIESKQTRQQIKYAILAGVVIAVQFLGTQTQIFYYGILIALVYFSYKCHTAGVLKSKKTFTRLFLLISLTGVVLISLSAIQLFPTLEFAKYASHGEISYKETTKISYAPYDFVNLFIPYIFGSHINDTYWGRSNIWENTNYVGILTLILVIIALIRTKWEPTIKFSSSAAVGSLLFAMGKFTPIFPLFFYTFPGITLFRNPARILHFFAFFMAILAAYGVQTLLTTLTKKKAKKKISKQPKQLFTIKNLIAVLKLTSKVALIGAFLTLVLKPVIINFGKNVVTTLFNNHQDSHRVIGKSLEFFYGQVDLVYQQIASGVVLFTILLIASALLLHHTLNKKISTRTFKILLALILIIDIWAFAYPLVVTENVDEMLQKTPEITFLEENLKDKSNTAKGINQQSHQYRTLFLQTDHSQTKTAHHNIERVGGYDSMMAHWYYDYVNLITEYTGQYRTFLPIGTVQESKLHLLNPLNVKYILSTEPLAINGLTEIKKEGKHFIYENPHVMPRFALIPNAKVIEDENELKKELQTTDLTQTVLLESGEDLQSERNENLTFTIDIRQHTSQKTQLSIQTNDNAYLFISETWYPGWEATRNGKSVEIHKANLAFKAIFIPKGTHTVTLEFKPKIYSLAKTITFAAIIVIILFFVGDNAHRKGTERKKKHKKK